MTSSNVPPRFAAALLALSAISLPGAGSGPDTQREGSGRPHTCPAGRCGQDHESSRDGECQLPEGHRHDGRTGARDRYATLVLRLPEGKDITLSRSQLTVLSPGGFTWRGQSETAERAVLMLWNDGHLSGYFGYQGRLFSVNHMGGWLDPVKNPSCNRALRGI